MTEQQKAYLRYLQSRQTPVTAFEMAARFRKTPESVSHSLLLLFRQGLVKRDKRPYQTGACSRIKEVYFYEAVDKKIKALKYKKKAAISYHNPFNLP